MCLNLSFEVKNQPTFYKVRWFNYTFIQYIRCFQNFLDSANILSQIPLKMGKMKKNLSPAYCLKLKNIISFLNRGLIFFFKWSYSF